VNENRIKSFEDFVKTVGEFGITCMHLNLLQERPHIRVGHYHRLLFLP